MKIAKRIKENRIFFITFILISLVSAYYIASKGLSNLMENFYSPLYVVDFNCGYSSRLLIGAIFSLFRGDKINILTLTKILLVFYFICCFLISLFVNNRLKKTKFEYLTVYVVLIILSPIFISLIGYFGSTDVFWIMLALGSIAVVDKKYLRWLAPIFCAVAISIHEVFATTYMPVIALAILYQFAKKPTTGNFVYVFVSALIMGSATVYFMFIGDGTMKMTSDEMVAYAESRLDLNGENLSDYYLRSVFFWERDEVGSYNGFFGYLKYNFDRYAIGDPGMFKTSMVFNLLNIIGSVPFVCLMIKSFKTEKNTLKKFIFIASLLMIPATVATVFMSSDAERYSLHLFLPIAMFLLMLIKEKDKSFDHSYNFFATTFAKHKYAFILVSIAFVKIMISGVRF